MTQTALVLKTPDSNSGDGASIEKINPEYCCDAPLQKKVTDILRIYTCNKCNHSTAISR